MIFLISLIRFDPFNFFAFFALVLTIKPIPSGNSSRRQHTLARARESRVPAKGAAVRAHLEHLIGT
jgi:hypothetical protein